jgi:hypothetical protein
MKPRRAAPRLHALLARDAALAVVLRRGPSRCVASFLWDRTNDTFSLGQWIRARVYEKRCDLSLDGRFLITFCLNGKWKSEARGAWTAVSKTPYLKALDLYANGEAMTGGGVFASNKSYWLNALCFDPAHMVRHTSGLTREAPPATHFGTLDKGVYFPRLLRDGWTLADPPEWATWTNAKPDAVFEKPLRDGWRLRKIPRGRDEHTLIDSEGGEIALPDWDWADVDRGDLSFAHEGRLFRAAPARDLAPLMLHDFRSYTFDAIEAPY